MTFPADSRRCDSGIGGYDGHLQRKRGAGVVEMCVISFHSTDCNQARVLLLGKAYQRLAIKPPKSRTGETVAQAPIVGTIVVYLAECQSLVNNS